mmetsp:Transcript_29903/g.27378  ORF Transcript_29903/g.27378 Transcript_29903/m.27378 type:complete len:111 (+) Transcript_29903:878-1210(+)
MRPFFSPEACSILSALLVVDPKKRLCNAAEIKRHEFFKKIDFTKLQRKEVKAPFIPDLKGPKDLKYFDKMFTGESVNETPINTGFEATTMNTYQGFTYNKEDMRNNGAVN